MSNMNKVQLVAAIAAIVAAAKAKQLDGDKARGDNENAITGVRKLAVETTAAGFDSKTVAELLQTSLVAGGVKANTARPYASAFRGYRVALAEGTDIAAFNKKGDKVTPMTAPQAREKLAWSEMTEAEREQAKAEQALDAIRSEIGKRAAAVTDTGTLEAIRDMLPAVEAEATAATETAAQKATREANERLAVLLATVPEVAPEAEDAEPVAHAA